MLFAEDYAGVLLVVHTALAAALVAATTHLVLWMRGFPRRRYRRLQAVRRFSIIAASLFVATFIVGHLIYPVYKVRVRAEYLDRGNVVVDDYRARQASRQAIRERHGATPDLTAGASRDVAARAAAVELPRRTAKVARWFDVKEHWVALGMILSLACAAIMWSWNPKRHSAAIADIAFLMAAGAALATWFGAVVGVVVASYRSIGGVG